MTFVVETIAVGDTAATAIKIAVMYDDEPDADAYARERAEASAIYRRRYQTWAKGFLQTVQERPNGEKRSVYGGGGTQ